MDFGVVLWLGTKLCGTAESRQTDDIRGEVVVGGRKQAKVGWVEGKVGGGAAPPTTSLDSREGPLIHT